MVSLSSAFVYHGLNIPFFSLLKELAYCEMYHVCIPETRFENRLGSYCLTVFVIVPKGRTLIIPVTIYPAWLALRR
jgi:hypothetical protein